MRTLLYIWHSFFKKSYPEEVADILSCTKPRVAQRSAATPGIRESIVQPWRGCAVDLLIFLFILPHNPFRVGRFYNLILRVEISQATLSRFQPWASYGSKLPQPFQGSCLFG